jgi:hypothetical protein
MEVDHDHKVTPFDFEVTGSKVKVTGTLKKKLFPSIAYNACQQCIDFDIFTFEACRIHNLAMHWLSNLRFGREVVLELKMATVDSDKVVCGGIHAMTVAVLVIYGIKDLSL